MCTMLFPAMDEVDESVFLLVRRRLLQFLILPYKHKMSKDLNTTVFKYLAWVSIPLWRREWGGIWDYTAGLGL